MNKVVLDKKGYVITTDKDGNFIVFFEAVAETVYVRKPTLKPNVRNAF